MLRYCIANAIDADYHPGDDSRVKFLCGFVLLFLSLIAPSIASAQTSLPIGDRLRVYLVTFGPGSDPWEKFGHDCIVIEDQDAMTSAGYNWGVFSFGQGFGGFVSFGVQFLRGRLLYSMQSDPTGPMIDAYIQNNRSVLIQELRMSPQQKQELQGRLIANDTEANRYYLYDYFKKNCSTMCRDEIDRAVGGAVAQFLNPIQTGTTYRWHDQRATADCLWLYLFLDFTLGHPVDRPLSAWQESFLPGKLAEHIRLVKVPDEMGQQVPLVKWEKQLAAGSFAERSVPPKSFFYYFLASGILAGAIIAGLAFLGIHFWVARWFFILIAMTWSLLTGMLGLLLSYIWFSDHQAAKWNENWLQGNPLSLLMIVLAPMAYRWPRVARRIAVAIFAISLAGLIAKITPWAWQVNGSIIAIALPVHAAIAWGILRRTRQARTASAIPDLDNVNPA